MRKESKGPNESVLSVASRLVGNVLAAMKTSVLLQKYLKILRLRPGNDHHCC
jgi:hypothetical protein